MALGKLNPARLIVPRTLFARSLMIVVMPLIILQLVLVYVFYERHWDTVTRWLSLGLAGEVALLVHELEGAETRGDQRRAVNRASNFLGLSLSLEADGQLVPEMNTAGFFSNSRLDEQLRASFDNALDVPFAINTRPDPPSLVAIYIQLDDALLRVLAPRKRVDSTTTTLFMVWMIGASLLLLTVSIYFLRRQVRPIRRLVAAVEGFGKGRDIGDFKLEGAVEIRHVAYSFNVMRRRILRHISQRTEMLAAVSHDLRTPLTRMKLELEMMAGRSARPEVEELRSDVREMQHLVETYLDFARGEGGEAIETVDVGELLTDVVGKVLRNGTTIHLDVKDQIFLPLRPMAMRRCLTNLIENACRYGDAVRIKARRKDDFIEIRIDDDGPGIAREHREEVFQAFYRVDRSRNVATGGVGLGLTIARDVALGHGGDITLNESPLGGLRATIHLPD